MTTGATCSYSAGWAPLYVYETTTSQLAIYRIVQQTVGTAATTRLELVESGRWQRTTGPVRRTDESSSPQNPGTFRSRLNLAQSSPLEPSGPLSAGACTFPLPGRLTACRGVAALRLLGQDRALAVGSSFLVVQQPVCSRIKNTNGNSLVAATPELPVGITRPGTIAGKRPTGRVLEEAKPLVIETQAEGACICSRSR